MKQWQKSIVEVAHCSRITTEFVIERRKHPIAVAGIAGAIAAPRPAPTCSMTPNGRPGNSTSSCAAASPGARCQAVLFVFSHRRVLVGEHVCPVATPSRFHYRTSGFVEDDEAILAVLHEGPGNKSADPEQRRDRRGN